MKDNYAALETQNKALQRELETAKQRGGFEETNWKEAERADPANKQVAFLGWPAGVAAQRRLELLENWVKTALPTQRPLSFSNEYKGPYSNRTLGQAAYANFTTADEVREFLASFKDSGQELEVKGTKLKVVQARTKLRKSRNWALKKAVELLKAAAGEGANTELNWEGREVTVNSVVAFKQAPGEPKGSFQNSFARLALP